MVHDAVGGSLHARVGAASRLADLARQTYDWIFLTVKAFDVASALASLTAAGLLAGTDEATGVLPDPRSPGGPRLVGFQNGVGTEDLIAARLGSGRSFVCVVTRPIALTEKPGVLQEAKRRGGVALAPYDAGGTMGDLDAILDASRLEVARLADHRSMKWSKLLLNATANATCAILDVTPASLYADADLFAIEHAAFTEALAVMKAMQIVPVDLPGYPVRRFVSVMTRFPRPVARRLLKVAAGSARGSKLPSLRLEMERTRSPERASGIETPSEVAWLNGAVVEYARRCGLQAPVNELLTRALLDVMSGNVSWEVWRNRPDRLVAEYRRVVH